MNSAKAMHSHSSAGQSSPDNHYPVIIIGGGQAGLSMSYCLTQKGIAHIIFEKKRIGHSWRTDRWDAFCLVTPNWQCNLPGYSYNGPDPKGFMVKDEIVRFIEDYAKSFNPPVREGVAVQRLSRLGDNAFEVVTDAGVFTAGQVIVATGGFHVPVIPRLGERFPADIVQIHSLRYTNSASLPPGDVLVVGTGQSGCQIAEDLHLAGRRVHLCVGGAPRTARLYRGRDVVEWLQEMGYYDIPIEQHRDKDAVRLKTNHYVTGRDGGRDLDLRKFATEGMQLYGTLNAVENGRLRFEPDLTENLDHADQVAEAIKDTIDRYIESQGIEAPTESRYVPLWKPESDPVELDYAQAGIRSVIWCTGIATDYRWIDLPLFDGKGYPAHTRGVTSVPGIYFLGLPWLHTWGSGRFSGVARDAEHLAGIIH